MSVSQESLFIAHEGGSRLHMRRIHLNGGGPAVFLLHGAVENGRIFYSQSGKGFAPFLAARGYDVFVADLAGRGRSEPAISRHSDHGQHESIRDEIPAFIEEIRRIKGDVPLHWGAHSWGGVLLLSALARRPELAPPVRSIVFFATKRSIRALNPEIVLKIHFFWNRFARYHVRKQGYLPAKEQGWGSDNETRESHAQSVAWVRPGPWVDPKDGFDYGATVRAMKLPPILSLTGESDRCLGHPRDVRDFLYEAGVASAEFRLLGKVAGNLHDYGHNDILTHPDAPRDHFPAVLDWMRARE